MIRIIVAGPRDYNNQTVVFDYIKKVILDLKLDYKDLLIVSGGARGVDYLGEEFAQKNNVEFIIYKADWDLYGKSAGYIRNSVMADNADILIAFYNGSRGTSNMIKIANKKGLKIFVCRI